MSFENLTKSLATLAAAHGLAAAQGQGDAGNPGSTNTNTNAGEGEGEGVKTPEQLEAEEAAAAQAQADADAAAAAAAAAAANTGEGEGTELGKSLTLTLADGTELEAFDGGEMLKALGERMDANEGTIKQLLGQTVMLLGAQSGQIAELTKSLGEATALVQTQGETIGSLRADLDALRNQPAGRKSVANPANVDGAAPMVKSLANGDADQKGLPPQEFLAKCLTLQKGGLLSLQECAMAEAAIGSGLAVPDTIRAKVFSN